MIDLKFIKDLHGVTYYQEALPDYYTQKPSHIVATENKAVSWPTLIQSAINSISDYPITLVLGKAGTGKSSFVRWLSSRPKLQNKMVIAAPTGIAAQNIGGQTIHSLFGLPLKVWNKSLINKSDHIEEICHHIKLLVIDEISMVRADILDAVNYTMQYHRGSREPFGGVRTLIIGDLRQLPPVLKEDDKDEYYKEYTNPYFFDSKVIQDAIRNNQINLVEFNIPFRQQEGDEFLNALDKISQCNLDGETERLLQTRIADQEPPSRTSFTILSPYRAAARRYNLLKLYQVNSPSSFYQATITGSYFKRTEDELPNELLLEFKVGARVVFVKNDPGGNWVNGTIGKIVKLSPDHVDVEVNGKTKSVTKVTWSEYHYAVRGGRLEKIEVGKFEQLPIRLGWALTIHKSQGLTLDNVYLDLGRRAFAFGQVYVGLSRVRKLEDILLKRPIRKEDLIDEHGVEKFIKELNS